MVVPKSRTICTWPSIDLRRHDHARSRNECQDSHPTTACSRRRQVSSLAATAEAAGSTSSYARVSGGTEVSEAPGPYLLSHQPTELERLQLQSRVWEPAGRTLLGQLPGGSGQRALDVGCGVMGWLRILSEWVGPDGSVVGSDVDDQMLTRARVFIGAEALANVTLEKDDLFATRLPAGSFDLVHARFQIAPLGRADEQLAIYRRLLRPGGWLVLEDPDMGSWRVNPDAPAVSRLIGLIEKAFLAAGGNFNAGRDLPGLFRQLGVEPRLDARVVALSPGHPYLRLPLQFAASLQPRLETLIGKEGLEDLVRQADAELCRHGTWGTTFTLIQACARLTA
ncbi:MAG TPA: methyltransferase domain-containing protein [Gemmatimonadales bacterium]